MGEGAGIPLTPRAAWTFLGWLLDSSRAQGFELRRMCLGGGPACVQFIVEQEGLKPGKWEGVVSQPWFQYERASFSYGHATCAQA
jgi:hypothetical protein